MHALAGCNTILLKSWRRKFIFTHPIYLREIWVKFAYWVKVTVTAAKKGKNCYSRNVNLPMAITVAIIDRTMRFVCSFSFLAMTDRIVWPPSLLSDQKWPCVSKCLHSRVVSLRLDGSLVRVNILMCVGLCPCFEFSCVDFVVLITLMVTCANCVVIIFTAFICFICICIIHLLFCVVTHELFLRLITTVYRCKLENNNNYSLFVFSPQLTVNVL